MWDHQSSFSSALANGNSDSYIVFKLRIYHEQAKAVVITPTQFGDGNLCNLEAAETALENGIPTILLEDGPIEERDFTRGKATEYLKKLKSMGANTVKSIKELVQFINALENKNNESTKTKNS